MKNSKKKIVHSPIRDSASTYSMYCDGGESHLFGVLDAEVWGVRRDDVYCDGGEATCLVYLMLKCGV